jgi:hypothetical protein
MKTATRKRNKPMVIIRQRGGGGKIQGREVAPGEEYKTGNTLIQVHVKNTGPVPIFLHLLVETE